MKRMGRISGILVMALLCGISFLGPAQSATKDTLIYIMGVEPPSLDPPNQSDNMSETVIRHIYDLPIQLTSKGTLVPGLFTKWEPSPDGKTWTFSLRKGVKFHDGTPFNAEAVKFNWDRAMSEEKKVIRKSIFEKWCQNIKIIDDYTIQTTSSEPFAPTVRFVSHTVNAIVSPAAIKKYGDQLNRNAVGTGPFKFVEWVAGDRIVMERNDDFWGEKPKFKRLLIRFTKETGSRVMMLETGEADLILKIPPVDVERLKKDPNVEALILPSNRVIGFYVNVAAPLTNDLRFRQALAYAIDKDAIIKNVMKGVARPCCSILGGGTFGEMTPKCYEYNPQKAKDLLKEMGYKGEKLILMTPQGRYVNDRETAEAVQAYWNQVGINVDFQVTEFATLDRAVRLPPDKVKYQVALLGSAPSTMDGAQVVEENYASRWIPPEGRNYSRYNNPEYDKVCMAQGMEMDEQKRKELLKQCQEILARDLPYISLYTIDQVLGIRKSLKGVEVLPIEMAMVREAYFQ